jgi:hypothetical protein
LKIYWAAKSQGWHENLLWISGLAGAVAILAIYAVNPAIGIIVAAVLAYLGFGTRLAAKERVVVTNNQEDIREKFVTAMTDTVGNAQDGGGEAESLDALEFASRLAETDVGRAIMTRTKGEIRDQVTDLVEDLVRRFDSHGAGASAGFRVLSQRYAVRIAFVVALVANIDAVNLLQHFIDNPKQAERVASMGEDAIIAHKNALKILEDEKNILDMQPRPGSKSSLRGICAASSRDWRHFAKSSTI